MTEGEEVTIREGTIITLERSIDGFKELKLAFKDVSSSFDSGQNIEGLELIKTSVIPNTNAMYGFFLSLVRDMSAVIEEQLAQTLIDKLNALIELMQQLEKETNSGQLIEVGDILQFDYFDLLSELETLVPELISKVRESTVEGLDEY